MRRHLFRALDLQGDRVIGYFHMHPLTDPNSKEIIAYVPRIGNIIIDGATLEARVFTNHPVHKEVWEGDTFTDKKRTLTVAWDEDRAQYILETQDGERWGLGFLGNFRRVGK